MKKVLLIIPFGIILYLMIYIGLPRETQIQLGTKIAILNPITRDTVQIDQDENIEFDDQDKDDDLIDTSFNSGGNSGSGDNSDNGSIIEEINEPIVDIRDENPLHNLDNLYPIRNNTINVQFMTRCWIDNCKSEIIKCNYNDQAYYLNYSYKHNQSTHIQTYHDPNLRSDNNSNHIRWDKKDNVPINIECTESYVHTRCMKFEHCVQKFNWISSTTPDDPLFYNYYTAAQVRDKWLEPLKRGETKPSFEEIMEKKIMFRRHEKEIHENEEYKDAPETTEYKAAPITWFASNCGYVHSNREKYAKEMMKYIKIDSYGRCARNRYLPVGQTNKSPNHIEFKLDLISKYKFYLSFENSFCLGYITEKPFECLESGTIPIIMTHPTTLSSLPRGSYIYVGNFTSAKQLSEYIDHLENNPMEYKKYFEWRSDINIIQEWHDNLLAKSKTGYDDYRCGLVDLYMNWRKDGLNPLLPAKTHDKQFLQSNFLKIT